MERATRTKWMKRGAASMVLAAGLGVAGTQLASAATTAPSKPGNAPASGRPGASGHPGRGHRPPGGKVTALSSTSITVAGPKGNQRTFTLDSSTTYRQGRTGTTTYSALKVGDFVAIRPVGAGSGNSGSTGPSSTSATAATVIILPAPPAGAPGGGPQGPMGPGGTGASGNGTGGSGSGTGSPSA